MVEKDEYGEEAVPTWLELPASDAPISPPVITRPQILPLHELSWENFERLCLRYVRSKATVSRCQLYGKRGQAQQGIDLYARFSEPAFYGVYQCKRLKSFQPGDISEAVETFLGGTWSERARAFSICTSHSTESTGVAEAIEAAAQRLEAMDIRFDVLGAEQLSLWLKEQPTIVDDFFSRAWVQAFCGTDALHLVGTRLNSSEVASYRKALHDFYNVLFTRHDPGIPIRPQIGKREAQLRDRFVTPTVYASSRYVPSEKKVSANGMNKTVQDSAEMSGQGTRRDLSGSVDQIKVRVSVDIWLSQSQRSVILGGPGSGKSALLRMLATDLLSDNPELARVAVSWGALLPVWIPFPYWTNLNAKRAAPVSLSQCLEQWFRQFDQPDTWKLVEDALRDDRLLLLVDGLDEWTDETAARTTSQLLQTYVQTRNLAAVLVSRPHGFERVAIQGAEWQVGQLAPLSAELQRVLIGKWLRIQRQSAPSESPDKAATSASVERDIERETDIFVRELGESSDLSQLAEIPLTLLLLLYLHLQNSPLPANRFGAYGYVVDHFIREHPLSRRSAATLVDGQGPLSPEEIERALAYIAYVIQTDFPGGTLQEREIRDRLEEFLRDELDLGLGLSSVEARAVLRYFTNLEEGSLGLLVSQGNSSISFFHRSLQEYLAAVHLARHPLADQRKAAASQILDARWREVILALIWLCRRNEDAEQLIDAIERAAVDPITSLSVEDLLGEVCFGEFAISAARSRAVGATVCDRIETSFVESHRSRLLRHVLGGVRSRKTKSLVQERVKRWMFSRGFWGPASIAPLRDWPATEHTWSILFRALHDEQALVVREASVVVAKLFGQSIEKGEEIAKLALRSPSAVQRAACITSLSEGWPESRDLRTAISNGHESASNELKIASIAAALNLKEQTNDDFAELLRLSRDRYSLELDYAWRDDTSVLLCRGWAGDSRLKSACLEASQHHSAHPELMDREIAQHVLVQAFPQDDDVAQFIVKELQTQHPFLSGRSVWADLAVAFRDNPRVVAALDEWVVKSERWDPIELHDSALVGRTEIMKEKLFEALDKWVPFWAVDSLLRGWGMSDIQVAERLTERVRRRDAAGVAQFIPKIIPDSTQARDRLLALLRDPPSERLDFVMRGFSELRPFPNEGEVIDAALERLRLATPSKREMSVGSVICTFPSDDRVKTLALECLDAYAPPLEAIAEAYAEDDEMRLRVGELITPLPATLRYQIVSNLAFVGDSAFALETLKHWDSERNGEVKTQASIQFHSLLRRLDLERESAIDYLDELLPCYGPDHEERRQAAAAGLIALGHLQIVIDKKEDVGFEGKQVNIPVADGLRPNRVFLDYLGSNWVYIKVALGESLDILKSRIGPEGLWTALAKVAAEHSALAKDLLAHAESDANFSQSASFLMLNARLEPRSETLLHLCFAVLRDRTQRHDWFDSVETSAAILAEHFRGDAEVEKRLLALAQPHYVPVGVVMALSQGWPHSELLRHIDIQRDGPGARDAASIMRSTPSLRRNCYRVF